MEQGNGICCGCPFFLYARRSSFGRFALREQETQHYWMHTGAYSMESTHLDAQRPNAPVLYLEMQSPTRYCVAQALASSRHLYSVVNTIVLLDIT